MQISPTCNFVTKHDYKMLYLKFKILMNDLLSPSMIKDPCFACFSPFFQRQMMFQDQTMIQYVPFKTKPGKYVIKFCLKCRYSSYLSDTVSSTSPPANPINLPLCPSQSVSHLFPLQALVILKYKVPPTFHSHHAFKNSESRLTNKYQACSFSFEFKFHSFYKFHSLHFSFLLQLKFCF